MSRVYGRPVQSSEEGTPESDSLREIRDMLGAMTREERKDPKQRQARRAVSARKPLGGLAILEACCFVGAAGGVAGAVRMSAGAR